MRDVLITGTIRAAEQWKRERATDEASHRAMRELVVVTTRDPHKARGLQVGAVHETFDARGTTTADLSRYAETRRIVDHRRLSSAKVAHPAKG
ncbi:hypothetical protein SAMN04515671_2932 [Nakamurella panacisegetis]|uniref:Uncharacterized protein n=1 Tax=Nakamurella panacisegetis TaxID=1090615 RepID=A0A1H0PYT4_9ACTN|nr:hypothetical protein [Nakamurella panacisegetis]SDP09885.1 hypothetical protein SAMN04515671_2932 [Nakamurella panacisegetis]